MYCSLRHAPCFVVSVRLLQFAVARLEYFCDMYLLRSWHTQQGKWLVRVRRRAVVVGARPVLSVVRRVTLHAMGSFSGKLRSRKTYM